MPAGPLVVAVSAVLLAVAVPAAAQSALPVARPDTIHRVFLLSGEPLPTYGEPLLLADRVIFNLLVGPHREPPVLQLVSLPRGGVDAVRTARYSEAMRAAHYSATRGEVDYLGLTTEVARLLDQLGAIEDPRQRLALAEAARRRLMAWPDEHYQYRADDIRGLAALFDGVIAELRAAIGIPGVSLDFVAGRPPLEPLLPSPSLREAVALALRAAGLADNGVERVEILRRASDAAEALDDRAVALTVAGALASEQEAGTRYALVLSSLRAAALRARRAGDLAALERLVRDLDARDAELGHRRPADVLGLRHELTAALESVQRHREAVEAYELQVRGRRRYAGQVRPLLGRLSGVESGLEALRDMQGITPARLGEIEATLVGTLNALDRVAPPAALADVHVMLRNALLFARQAAVRRREARSSQAGEMRESSSAAAGALLLATQVRRDLDTSLRRPSIQ